MNDKILHREKMGENARQNQSDRFYISVDSKNRSNRFTTVSFQLKILSRISNCHTQGGQMGRREKWKICPPWLVCKNLRVHPSSVKEIPSSETFPNALHPSFEKETMSVKRHGTDENRQSWFGQYFQGKGSVIWRPMGTNNQSRIDGNFRWSSISFHCGDRTRIVIQGLWSTDQVAQNSFSSAVKPVSLLSWRSPSMPQISERRWRESFESRCRTNFSAERIAKWEIRRWKCSPVGFVPRRSLAMADQLDGMKRSIWLDNLFRSFKRSAHFFSISFWSVEVIQRGSFSSEVQENIVSVEMEADQRIEGDCCSCPPTNVLRCSTVVPRCVSLDDLWCSPCCQCSSSSGRSLLQFMSRRTSFIHWTSSNSFPSGSFFLECSPPMKLSQYPRRKWNSNNTGKFPSSSLSDLQTNRSIGCRNHLSVLNGTSPWSFKIWLIFGSGMGRIR